MTLHPKSGSPTEPAAHLIEEFQKLPGIGPKNAAWLMYHVLHVPDADLARGLPMGSDLEYADETTLGQALRWRRDVQ